MITRSGDIWIYDDATFTLRQQSPNPGPQEDTEKPHDPSASSPTIAIVINACGRPVVAYGTALSSSSSRNRFVTQDQDENDASNEEKSGIHILKSSIDFNTPNIQSINWSSLIDASKPSHCIPNRHIHTLSSTSTTFTLLTSSGELHTFASDPRHPHLLGRPVTPTHPSRTPCIVEDLAGIPIKKVATSEWHTAAISEAGEAYVWGAAPGDGRGTSSGVKDGVSGLVECVGMRSEDETVTKVDLAPLGEEDVEVVDVALTREGIVVVTEIEGEQRVWAIGTIAARLQNQRGSVDHWIRLPSPDVMESGKGRIVEVAANEGLGICLVMAVE